MREALAKAKKLVAEGAKERALDVLRGAFAPNADFAVLTRAVKWTQDVSWEGLRPMRAAFLGGGTLEQLVAFIRFRMLLEGFALDAYIAPFNAWKMDTLAPASGIYAFSPDIVWFFTHSRDIHLLPDPDADWSRADEIACAALVELESYWGAVRERLPKAQLIQNTMELPAERPFGHFEASLFGSKVSLVGAFNRHLTRQAASAKVALFDLGLLASFCGLARWHDPAYWFHSKHPFSPELAGFVAFQAARLLAAVKGTSKKVIVLDLDNTLWGGVIGDDGIEGIKLGNGADGEAFVAFQHWLKSLADRGVLLTVASKNEEAAAKLPFQTHPEMVLSLDDIAVFKADWRNKADNIREIAAVLNLGLDSFVFLDDNPAERALVRGELPMVAVPELPADPAEYVTAVEAFAFFETVAFSEEDRLRGRMYKENAARTDTRINATNIEDYLKGLEMVADCGAPDDFHIPRMSQLVNKSNQFHLTTTRYSEAEIRDMASSDGYFVRWFSLRDRFGDYGLIAVLALERCADALVIDTWAMSCRVLERGMEEFILRELASLTIETGATKLIGRYIPSKKNAMVAGLYDRLGFSRLEPASSTVEEWELSELEKPRTTALFITKTTQG